MEISFEQLFTIFSEPGKTVSVYGELCLNTCELNTDKRHYCTVYGGDIQQCGPQPNTTPQGDTCSSDCRKRDDGYFWCLRDDAPWDYCSPPLVFQQHLTCPPDATRIRVAMKIFRRYWCRPADT